MITLHRVTKAYRTNFGRRVILDDFSVELPRGRSLGILGVNGAGKTTLIRMLAGVELPDSGTIRRAGRISFPIGFAGTFSGSLSGRENTTFLARVYGLDPRDVIDFTREFSELGAYFDMPFGTYSSGMRARLSFAVSAALQFDIYLIDEVIAVGDKRFQERCRAILKERFANADVVMVSHDPGILKQYCDYGAILADGTLRFFPTIDEAYNEYAVQHRFGAGDVRVQIEGAVLDEPRPAVRVLAAGQSLARFYTQGDAGTAFAERLAECLDVSGKIEIFDYASGGAFLSMRNRDNVAHARGQSPTAGAKAFVNDGGAVAAPGQLMDYFQRPLSRLGPTQSNGLFDHVLLNIGHAEAWPASGQFGLDPAGGVQAFSTSLTYFANYLIRDGRSTRQDDKPSVIIVELLGRTTNRTLMGYDRIRQAQLRLAAQVPHVATIELYDLPLADSVHLSPEGQREQGRRAAEALAIHAFGKRHAKDDPAQPLFEGPRITAVERLDARTVRVLIDGAGEDIAWPSAELIPQLFAFADEQADLARRFETEQDFPVQRPVASAVEDGVLYFRLAQPLEGIPVLLYPYDNLIEFDERAVIRGARSRKPLRSWLR